MIAPVFDIAVLALAGLAVGSFLNVCIHRLPRRESIVWPGSHCPACGRPLAWFENVPLVSYLALRGRCRTCTARISARYPVVETVTAILFVLYYLHHGPQPLLAVRLIFASAMVALFAIDLEHWILPNAITLPGIVAGLVFSVFLPPGWRDALLGAIVGGGLLLIVTEVWVRVRGVEAMGMGDLKMLAMIGAFLGLRGVAVTIVVAFALGTAAGLIAFARVPGGPRYVLSLLLILVVLVASIAQQWWGLELAALAALLLWLLQILRRRAMQEMALPFGTCLAVGAIIASLGGERIVERVF